MNLQQSSLSKNALKKLLKQQKWEESRQERKAAQKEKDKKKKLEKKKAVELGLIPPPIKKPKPNQITSNLRVVIDLSFDSMMTDTEITSVSSQLTRCYSANRSTSHAVNLFFTSYGQRIQNRFDTKIQSHINWKDVVFDTKSYLERFDKDDLVYLTADATDVIDELDENKVYIIGGIVDKNRHKVFDLFLYYFAYIIFYFLIYFVLRISVMIRLKKRILQPLNYLLKNVLK
ncbi:tRNA m1G methyltransferase Trm10 predicted [Gigaspora margarita]|uniref:tRNA (guanine(9)-N1)-methyltransferase n=1 Tax=Gigaspora margarita TaxID=4874 RepID=A0A8H4A117_GIGMA|nr:tRNA m1G methyltransferase Trm10 predicted [Gigaspora margarita]